MRDPDWLIEHGFEIQADVEEREAEFLAPKRRVVPGPEWPPLPPPGPPICARCGSPRCQGGTDCDPDRYL